MLLVLLAICAFNWRRLNPPPTHPLPQDEALRKLQRKAESLEGLLAKHPLAGSPTLQSRLDTLLQKQVGLLAGRPAGMQQPLPALPACPAQPQPQPHRRCTLSSPPTHCTPHTPLPFDRRAHPPFLPFGPSCTRPHSTLTPPPTAASTTAHPSAHPYSLPSMLPPCRPCTRRCAPLRKRSRARRA